MVTRGNKLADIGTDHGYLPIELVRSGICPAAIAMDINEGPLERASEHVTMSGLSECIELRLSNGLERLSSGEAQTVTIAGMGGHLIINILRAQLNLALEMDEIIIGPQSDLEMVRRELRAMGFAIIYEDMVLEDGKFYPIIKIRRSDTESPVSENQELEDIYGPVLLSEKHPVLGEYLVRERVSKEQILTRLGNAGESGASRRAEIEHLLRLNETAMSMLGLSF